MIPDFTTPLGFRPYRPLFDLKITILTRFRTLAPLLLFLALQGCLPMGLPEHFSNLPSSTNHSQQNYLVELERSLGGRPRALIVVSSRCYLGPLVDENSRAHCREPEVTLGHQYLLTIFPFTRVYLQHSSESLMLESLQSVLLDAGYSPYIVDDRGAGLAAQLLKPILILKPSLEGLRANAYDLFFLRRISLDGEVGIEVLGPKTEYFPSQLAPRRKEIETIDTGDFKVSGHAPILAEVAANSVQEAFKKILNRVTAHSSPHTMTPAKASRFSGVRNSQGELESHKLLIINPPSFSTTPSPELGVDLAGSYGFSSIPEFPHGKILRVIQRGLEAGSVFLETSLISAAIEVLPKKNIKSSQLVWLLDSEISSLKSIGNEAQANFHFSLRDLSSDKLLTEANCVFRQPLNNHVDGARIVTLEELSSSAVKAFFQNGCQQ